MIFFALFTLFPFKLYLQHKKDNTHKMTVSHISKKDRKYSSSTIPLFHNSQFTTQNFKIPSI